jgi:hypothetical protein
MLGARNPDSRCLFDWLSKFINHQLCLQCNAMARHIKPCSCFPLNTTTKNATSFGQKRKKAQKVGIDHRRRKNSISVTAITIAAGRRRSAAEHF